MATHTNRASLVAFIGAVLSLLGILGAITAGLLNRVELVHFSSALEAFRWSVYTTTAGAIVSLLGTVFGLVVNSSRAVITGLIGALLGGALTMTGYVYKAVATSVPKIHDITTDMTNPPEFVEILPLRANAPNPAVYGGPEISELQAKAYPDIKPLVVQLPPLDAFQASLDAAKAMGWKIVSGDPTTGRIEASDRTFWFGFVDDIVVRLAPEADKIKIDVRSVSRVGKSDVGANAKRVRRYLSFLETIASKKKTQ